MLISLLNKQFSLDIYLYRPDLINYSTLRPNQHEANLNNAFNVAHESLGIAKLLDAEGNNSLMFSLFRSFL